MIKTLMFAGMTLASITVASAQTTVVPEREYDRGMTTQTIPERAIDRPGFNATMDDKSAGPGATTGTDYGPDGTPGNGSPAKRDGGQQ
jgi:hypothetical protein